METSLVNGPQVEKMLEPTRWKKLGHFWLQMFHLVKNDSAEASSRSRSKGELQTLRKCRKGCRK